MDSLQFYPSESPVFRHRSVNLPRNLKRSATRLRNLGAAGVDNVLVRWLLRPMGDGDSSHIGYKIEMPEPFEIATKAVTVGRDRERADIVVPVPTVSALHTRIQKTEDKLLITDLDSTNGTFIDERRLQPGVIATA